MKKTLKPSSFKQQKLASRFREAAIAFSRQRKYFDPT